MVHDGLRLVLGSSFEHEFSHLAPNPIETEKILAKAYELIPALRDVSPAEVKEVAGVRVTVPGTRLPCVGPLRESPNVWMFSALGAKGLLLAPYLAEQMPAYLSNPEGIPKNLRPLYRFQ